jgi:hypothetical protein
VLCRDEAGTADGLGPRGSRQGGPAQEGVGEEQRKRCVFLMQTCSFSIQPEGP